MNNPARAQTLDELRAQTDAQASELHAQLIACGQLPPPPGVIRLSAAQLPASVEALRDALSGHAVAWSERAAPGSAAMHYANGLLYAGVMLASCQRVEADPAQVLALFATWAASFARDVLTDSGLSEAVTEAALEGELDPALYARLPDGMPRGAAGAALTVFQAAACSVAALDPDHLMTLFAVTGHALTTPDRPSKGEGPEGLEPPAYFPVFKSG